MEKLKPKTPGLIKELEKDVKDGLKNVKADLRKRSDAVKEAAQEKERYWTGAADTIALIKESLEKDNFFLDVTGEVQKAKASNLFMKGLLWGAFAGTAFLSMILKWLELV